MPDLEGEESISANLTSKLDVGQQDLLVEKLGIQAEMLKLRARHREIDVSIIRSGIDVPVGKVMCW